MAGKRPRAGDNEPTQSWRYGIVSAVAVLLVGIFVGLVPQPSDGVSREVDKPATFRPDTTAETVSPQKAEEAAQLYRQGNLLFKEGSVQAAESYYERAVDADPTNSFAWANLGNLLRDRRDTQRAIRCHERAFQLSSERPRSSYNLAVSLQTAGKYHAASVMYMRAISLVEEGHGELDLSRVYTNLGVCFQGLGQLEQAVEQYALAKKLRPDLRSANLNYCNVMLPLKGADAAVGCFSSLLDRDPAFEQALSAAAGVHHLSDNLGAAAQLYQRALAVNPSSASAKHGLAAISGGGGDTAPVEYVRDMFNGYALTFDDSLKSLRYQSPELLRSAIDEHVGAAGLGDEWAQRSGHWRVLDAGCGTGLCGPLLRNLSAHLAGVDLSENMVALARKRQVYDVLAVGELVDAIRLWEKGGLKDGDEEGGGMDGAAAAPGQGMSDGAGEGGDVVVAADVLVYFGNLSPFLAAAAAAVRSRQGLVAFTTELLEGDECAQGEAGWKLMTSGRYAHCREYVERAARSTGKLQVVESAAVTPRWNRGKPVRGTLFLMRAR